MYSLPKKLNANRSRSARFSPKFLKGSQLFFLRSLVDTALCLYRLISMITILSDWSQSTFKNFCDLSLVPITISFQMRKHKFTVILSTIVANVFIIICNLFLTSMWPEDIRSRLVISSIISTVIIHPQDGPHCRVSAYTLIISLFTLQRPKGQDWVHWRQHLDSIRVTTNVWYPNCRAFTFLWGYFGSAVKVEFRCLSVGVLRPSSNYKLKVYIAL